MQPDDVDLNISNNEFYEQWKMLMLKIRFTSSGFKEKGIRKFEFEPKTLFLSWKIFRRSIKMCGVLFAEYFVRIVKKG